MLEKIIKVGALGNNIRSPWRIYTCGYDLILDPKTFILGSKTFASREDGKTDLVNIISFTLIFSVAFIERAKVAPEIAGFSIFGKKWKNQVVSLTYDTRPTLWTIQIKIHPLN